MSGEEQREDYYVKARFVFNGLAVEGVPCKIYLPRLPSGRPRAVLAPSVGQVEALSQSHKAAFSAELVRLDATQVSLRGNAFIDNLTSSHWGPDLTQCSGSIQFDDFHVVTVHTHSDLERSLQLDLCGGTQLMPQGSVGTSYDGGMSYTPLTKVSLRLNNGTVLTFRRHFVDLPAPEGEFRRTSYLVADCAPNADVTTPECVLDTVIPLVDDLLAIASLGARQRTACLRWIGAQGTRIAKTFRGGIARPAETPRRAIQDALIAPRYFIEFVQHGYDRLAVSDAKRGVMLCAYALSGQQRSLESHYLSLFAAFEALILAHRQSTGTDVLLGWDSPEWCALRRTIEAAVKGSDLLDDQRRSFLYDKIPELNRVSLAKAARSFFDRHSVQTGDLWPVFQPGGLDRIRNLLIHGSFPERLARELYAASDHLQWLLERSVLAVLGWDLAKSYVNSAALRAMQLTSYDRWALHFATVKASCLD